ncbi:MAG: hypothetical protein WC076_00195 [Terrimicrobiaceae bacterium]|jgi:hypothetical protein|nr:hypothetical protein [Terrimicrobiaceae bacterium]
MNNLERFGPWITGLVLCFGGVLLVRVPALRETSWLAPAAGYLLAGLGLLRIALGVRSRIDRCGKD